MLTDRVVAEKFKIAPDWTATSAMLRQRLTKNKTQSYQVQLPGPPYCHTYVVAGDDSVLDLDLSVKSPTGTAEAQDNVAGNIVAVQNHCPSAQGSYRLDVKMANGTGEFAVQVFSKSR